MKPGNQTAKAGLFMGGILFMPELRKQRWKCILCHYMYDPVMGDIEHGVKARVPFHELLHHWECPKCKSRKNLFRQVIEEESASL